MSPRYERKPVSAIIRPVSWRGWPERVQVLDALATVGRWAGIGAVNLANVFNPPAIGRCLRRS